MIHYYLVRQRTGDWCIARPGCLECDARETDNSPPLPISEQPLRLAWFEKSTDALVAFDFEEPEVLRLPEDGRPLLNRGEVFVIMSNDFPAGVSFSEKEADEIVRRENDLSKKESPLQRVFWRTYRFSIFGRVAK